MLQTSHPGGCWRFTGVAKVRPPLPLRFHQNPTSNYVQKCYKYLKTQKLSPFIFQVFFSLHGGAAGDGRGMVTWVGRHPNCGCRLCPERQNPEGPPQPQGNGPQLRFLLWARLCLCNPRHQCSLRDQPFAGSGVAGRHVHILGETSAALVAGQNQTPAGALCP